MLLGNSFLNATLHLVSIISNLCTLTWLKYLQYSSVVLPCLPVNMAEQDEDPAADTVHCCSSVSVPPPTHTHMLSVCSACVCLALFWSPMLVCLGCAGCAASMLGAELMACQVLPAGRLCLPLCSATVNAEPTDCYRGNTASSLLLFLSGIHTQRGCFLTPASLAFSPHPPISQFSQSHLTFFFSYHFPTLSFLSCLSREPFFCKIRFKDQFNYFFNFFILFKFFRNSNLKRFLTL